MNRRITMAVMIVTALVVALIMPTYASAATTYYSSAGSSGYQNLGSNYYSSGSGSTYYYNSNSSGGSTYYYSGRSYSNSGSKTYYYNSGNTWYSGGGSYTPSRPTPTPTPQPTPTPEPKPEPTPQPEPTPTPGLTADEQRMVDLINQERAKAGLAPLTVDLRLVDLARKKSQDMITNNYFSHTSPTYGDPFKMMTAAGISYRTAGENLAGARTVDQAHSALMNSAGHRQNILSPSYNKVGVGIATGGPYGSMYTQLFIGTW
jgi:uncharacterized YkwD family protein